MNRFIFGAMVILVGVSFSIMLAPVKSFAEPPINRIRIEEPAISMEEAIEIFHKTYPGVEVEDATYHQRGGNPTYFLFGRDQDENRYKMEIDAVDGTVLFYKKLGNYGNAYNHNRGYGYGRGGCCY